MKTNSKATRKVRSIQKDASTNRSTLRNLTKDQIIETLIAQKRITAFAHTKPLTCKKMRMRDSLFIESAIRHLDHTARKLAKLSKAELVDAAYRFCDDRLNQLNPGSRHRTLPTERRTDVRKKAFVLKKERKLELSPKWAKEWAKRDKKTYKANVDKVMRKVKRAAKLEANKDKKKQAPTIRLNRKPLNRRQSKAATRNWIAAMRQHNQVITSQSEPIFKSVEI